MKPRHLLQLAFLFCLVGSVHAQDTTVSRFDIVPTPAIVKRLQGNFTLNKRTRLLVTNQELRRSADAFNDFLLDNHGFRLKIDARPIQGRSYIVFTNTPSRPLPPEGYRLVIKPGRVVISGQSRGLFYGMQTLLQMMPLEVRSSVVLPAVDIVDFPRFPYRGVLLDVARHFFPIPTIKKVLDLLAQYKINRFQWHLTDDQAWRIDIKKYPELTLILPRATESRSVRSRLLHARADKRRCGVRASTFYHHRS